MKDYIIKHEGLRLKPYYCPAGKLTIGVGRNIEDNGISEDEALYLLQNDIERCVDELREIFDNFDMFDENKKTALIDIIFQLGKPRFLTFKKMIKAIKNEDWQLASKELKDSRLCKQVPNRCEDNVMLFRS